MIELLRHLRRKNGQSAVELALGFLIFSLVFLAVMEFGHLIYAKITLRHALRESGRYLVTGRASMPDPNNPGDILDRVGSVGAVFKRALIATGTGLRFMVLNPPDGGGPGDTVTLTAFLEKKFVTRLFGKILPNQVGCPSGNSFCFRLAISWVNEPFPVPVGS